MQAKAQQIQIEDMEELTGPPIFRHGIGYAGVVEYEGEMIPWFVLSDVYIFKPLILKNKKQVQKYYKLVNNIKKVYPIAVDIKRTIDATVAHMDSLPDKKAKDEYMKKMEKELKAKYTPQLKKLTFAQGFAQGKLLIKLIDRQTGDTSYQLIKQYIGSFKATMWNTFASLFGASLKKEYDPDVDDRLTERCILLIEAGEL